MKCSSCGGDIETNNKYCPGCGKPNELFALSGTGSSEFSPQSSSPQSQKRKKSLGDRIGCGGIVALVIGALLVVGLISQAVRGKTTPTTTTDSFSTTASPLDNSSITSSQWSASLPAGFIDDQALGLDTAWRAVPKNEMIPCHYCSATHGYSYWNVQFLSKNPCSLLYMNSAIYSASGVFEKYWYQKLYNTSASPVVYNAEIVTADPNSSYKILTLKCTP